MQGGMMRYTDKHYNLADGMQILIDLYYHLKETDRAQWMEEPVIQSIAKLAYKVIPNFKTCQYLKRSIPLQSKPRLQFFTRRQGIINLDENDFQKFVEAMDAFPGEREINPIVKLGANYEVKESVQGSGTADKVKWTIPPAVYRDSDDFLMKSFIPGSLEDNPAAKLYKGMIAPPPYHETIRVEVNPESNFANALYRLPGGNPDYPEYIDPISPYIKGGDTFLGLIRYFFAKYIEAFKSFDRITLCEYGPCKKLIFSIRLGERLFCDNKGVCKSAHHKVAQDPVKRKCRGKQNRWIRNKDYQLAIDHETVKKKEYCDYCQRPVITEGECPHLRELNKKIFTKIAAYGGKIPRQSRDFRG
jgi:hypothetical protein